MNTAYQSMGIDFYPTKRETLDKVFGDLEIRDKIVLEPSAGKGNILSWLADQWPKQLLACEIDDNLREMIKSRAQIIAADFLTVTSDQISHVDVIVMNPPFSKGAEHILHAYNQAPAGCTIAFILDRNAILFPVSRAEKELQKLFGTLKSESTIEYDFYFNEFSNAERKTDVDIVAGYLIKPGDPMEDWSEYFDMNPEEYQTVEGGEDVIKFDALTAIVNRYVGALKVYKKMIDVGVEMNYITQGYFGNNLSFTVNEGDKEHSYQSYKKQLQASAWKYVIDHFNLEQFATRTLKDQINHFVQKQTEVPFKVSNIIKMIEMIYGTRESRMEAAVMDVFNQLKKHAAENGTTFDTFKTNSFTMMNTKLILPYICPFDKIFNNQISIRYDSYQLFDDFFKALCWVQGTPYVRGKYDLSQYVRSYGHIEDIKTGEIKSIAYYERDVDRLIKESFRINSEPGSDKVKWVYTGRKKYGEKFDWFCFTVRCFKKGTMHLEFKDMQAWADLNKIIAKHYGVALPDKFDKYYKVKHR